MSAKKSKKTKVDATEEVCEGVCYHKAAVELISYLTRRLSRPFPCQRPTLQTGMFSALQTSKQKQTALTAMATTMWRFVFAFSGTWCIMGDLTRRLTRFLRVTIPVNFAVSADRRMDSDVPKCDIACEEACLDESEYMPFPCLVVQYPCFVIGGVM